MVTEESGCRRQALGAQRGERGVPIVAAVAGQGGAFALEG